MEWDSTKENKEISRQVEAYTSIPLGRDAMPIIGRTQESFGCTFGQQSQILEVAKHHSANRFHVTGKFMVLLVSTKLGDYLKKHVSQAPLKRFPQRTFFSP